jgi:hypothetical protein
MAETTTGSEQQAWQAWQARALAAESAFAAWRTVLEPLVETLHDRLAGGVLAELLRQDDPGRLIRRALDGWVQAEAHRSACVACEEYLCNVGIGLWEQAIAEMRALLGPDWRDLTPAVLGDQGDAAVLERGACELAVAEVLHKWGFTWAAGDAVAWDEVEEDSDLWPNGREDVLTMVREVVDAIRARGPQTSGGGDAHGDGAPGGGDVHRDDGADRGLDDHHGSAEGPGGAASPRAGRPAGGWGRNRPGRSPTRGG